MREFWLICSTPSAATSSETAAALEVAVCRLEALPLNSTMAK